MFTNGQSKRGRRHVRDNDVDKRPMTLERLRLHTNDADKRLRLQSNDVDKRSIFFLAMAEERTLLQSSDVEKRFMKPLDGNDDDKRSVRPQ